MLHVTPTRTPDRFLSDAITNALLELCIDAGFTSEYEEVDEDADTGEPVFAYLPNLSDFTRMARQPITAAALLDDLCARMGVTPPQYITAALTDAEPS